jgi:hypothetical protein
MLLLFVSNYILNVSFVLFQHFPQNGDLAFAYLVIGLVVAVLFAVVARTPPGFIMIEERQNDFEMLKRNHASKICFDCMVPLPLRSWSNRNVRGTARSASTALVYTTTTVPG